MRNFSMNVSIAVGQVFRAPRYRLLAMGLFALVLAVNLFTLPATYTGGVVGLISLRYLTVELGIFAVTLAVLFSLVLTLDVYAFRAAIRQRDKGLGVGALLAGFLPAGVCCTPLVPTLLAIMGASTPQIFGLTGRVQGFVATYESLFLAFAVVLLLVALRLVTRQIAGSCPVPERSPR